MISHFFGSLGFNKMIFLIDCVDYANSLRMRRRNGKKIVRNDSIGRLELFARKVVGIRARTINNNIPPPPEKFYPFFGVPTPYMYICMDT